MWGLRLLLLVVLLPWSSSVKREHTPAGTPLISESFGEVSSDSLHVTHELALDDAQREMSDFGESIGSCLMCGRRDIGVIRDGAAAGTPTCTHCRQSPKTYCYSNALSIAPPKNTNWLGAPMTHARSLQLLKKLQGATHAELSLLRIATPLISAFRLKLGQFAFRKSAISLANPSLAKAPSLPSARGQIYRR